jgi:aspartate carbamoyltransferase catalytic subunit
MMDKSFYGLPNVIEAQQFERDWMEKNLFPLSTEMEKVVAAGGSDVLRGKLMALIFTEPSTRTSISFEMAMKRQGGMVVERENASQLSSMVKGESDADMYTVLAGYRPDVIVIRHHEEGAAARAAKICCVPVINAGDGKGQHPTQALLDLYTIQKELGHIDGISIAMVGDLMNGRTVRSLSYLLGKFNGVTIYFVSPACAQMGVDIKRYLDRHGVRFSECTDLRKVAPHVDVIYQTRIQKERGTSFDQHDQSLGHFLVDDKILELMHKDAVIMHPLPRVKEIATSVDRDPRAAYFRQAENGLYVRMALLKMILAETK